MSVLVTHIMMALLWVGLTGVLSFKQFVYGLIIGFIILMILSCVFGHTRYTSRWISFWVFFFYFLKAFIMSSVDIIANILFYDNEALYPNIITYDVSELSDMEVMILSHCITLTPGTTTIQYEDGVLYVHAIQAFDPEEVRESIRDDLLVPILRFTR